MTTEPKTFKEAARRDRERNAQRREQQRDTLPTPGSWGEAEALDRAAREEAAKGGEE